MSKLNRRKLTAFKSSPLPADYLRMVGEVIGNNFEGELKTLGSKSNPPPQIVANGMIFPDEVLLSISIVFPKHLKALTSHASSDFDPQASSPKIDEILGFCLDAAGSLQNDMLKQAVAGGVDSVDPQPLEWSQVEIEKRRLYVRADRSNPTLDQAADEWLAANDPEHEKREEAEEAEIRKLFKTGPSSSGNGPH